ncbi:MAG: UV DNA damage repair endonuclease UvsE, partial [Chloroflexota bacterium]
MLRLGLVAKFAERPIRFRSTTATSLLTMTRQEALAKLSRIILLNAAALQQALNYCATNGIGAFRIGSDILPRKTHPDVGYDVAELPQAEELVACFRACGDFARQHDLRLSFHPSQFTLLSSADAGVTERSLVEIEYQAEV